jgi:PKD repeat protein
MTLIEKNKGKAILIVILFLLLVSFLVYNLQKTFFYTEADLDCSIHPTHLKVGDTLFYSDNSLYNGLVKWEFGDGGVSLSKSGYHFFSKPGYYQINFTLNNQVSKTFSVEVTESKIQHNNEHITHIEAPNQAMQGENIVFRAVTNNTKLFSWKFGETGSVDAKEPLVIYSYNEPGVYEVTLFTDKTTYPVTHRIEIYPSFKNINETLTIEDGFSEIDEDFRYNLQQIANGSNFNSHYNYLFNNYLCKNPNISVDVNKSTSNTFYYYCMGLRFDRNIAIQSVKVGFDEAVNCVTKISIVQSK